MRRFVMKDAFYLYEKIYHDLLEKIQSGQWETGFKLPTEHELAEEYKVSRITSKKALNMLAEEGLVTRRPGIGTVVITNQLSPSGLKENGALSSTTPSNTLIPLGLIMEDIGESYSSSLYYALEKEAIKAGYYISLAISYGNQKKEREALRQLLSLNVAGIMIVPAHGRFYNTDLLRLVLNHFPVVLLDRPLVGVPAASVHSDNFSGSKNLVEHLLGHGHRNIGFITAHIEEALSLEDRYQGYVKTMEKNHLFPLAPLVISSLSRHVGWYPEAKNDFLKTIEEIKAFILQHPSTTAFICAEYPIAYLTNLALKEIAVPNKENFAIVSFDAKYNHFSEFEFTHIKQDEKRLAQQALQVIHAMIEGKNMRRQNFMVPVQLLTIKK